MSFERQTVATPFALQLEGKSGSFSGILRERPELTSGRNWSSFIWLPLQETVNAFQVRQLCWLLLEQQQQQNVQQQQHEQQQRV